MFRLYCTVMVVVKLFFDFFYLAYFSVVYSGEDDVTHERHEATQEHEDAEAGEAPTVEVEEEDHWEKAEDRELEHACFPLSEW